METKHRDLLYADEQYIAHQCNCVTNTSKGLAGGNWPSYKKLLQEFEEETGEKIKIIS